MRTARTSVPPGPGSGAVPVGRIGGIRILLSWSWLLSVVAVAILATPVVKDAVTGVGSAAAVTVAVVLGLLLGLSVLVHELGHCLAARILGVPVLSVRLYLLGGVSELGRSPVSPREEAVVAAAGPGLSALLSALFFLLLGSVDPHTVVWLLLVELALTNAVVAVFNLLPALPLDGGRVLRAGVWKLTGGRRSGTLAACVGGYLIAAGLLVWAVVLLFGSGRGAQLQAVIAIATGAFVAFGAAQEQRANRAVPGAASGGLAAAATPVVQLPMEVPLSLALQAAGTRAVLLTGPDGVVAGLLDGPTAVEAARTDPQRPALGLARPITAEQVVLIDDDPAEVLERIRGLRTPGPGRVPDPVLLLVDETGRPAGVISAASAYRILTGPDTPAPARARGHS